MALLTFRVLALATLALMASGCASVEVGRAQALGKAGVAASAQIDTAASQVATGYRQGHSDENLKHVLVGGPEPKDSPAYKSALTRLQAREQVASALKDAYAGFDALASYNASGEFQQSAKGFFDAVNGAADITGSGSKVSETLVEQVGGELLAWRQAGKLKKASKVLREGLEAYLKTLQHSSKAYIDVGQEAVKAHYGVVRVLWEDGLLNAHDVISGLAPEPGLALAGGNTDYTHTNPRADAIVGHVLNEREEAALEAVNDSDAATQALVKKLIRQHEKFEAGGPLSLSELSASADELIQASQALVAARGGK